MVSCLCNSGSKKHFPHYSHFFYQSSVRNDNKLELASKQSKPNKKSRAILTSHSLSLGDEGDGQGQPSSSGKQTPALLPCTEGTVGNPTGEYRATVFDISFWGWPASGRDFFLPKPTFELKIKEQKPDLTIIKMKKKY